MVTAIMFIVVCQTALMQLYYHNTINIITICNNVQRKCNYDAVLIPLRWDKLCVQVISERLAIQYTLPQLTQQSLSVCAYRNMLSLYRKFIFSVNGSKVADDHQFRPGDTHRSCDVRQNKQHYESGSPNHASVQTEAVHFIWGKFVCAEKRSTQ